MIRKRHRDFFSVPFVFGGEFLDNNWIVENLNGAFDTWNSKMVEIWSLLSETPQNFKGGAIWTLAETINGALQAIGYGLLILFFAMSIFKSAMSFQDFRRPEQLLRYFLRFVAAKTAVTYCMDIMLLLFDICSGIISTIANSMGSLSSLLVTLPTELETAVTSIGFLESIPLWLVTILGSIFITVLSFVMILTVYNRFFRLYMYTALAPVPLATFAGEGTSATGKAFLKSYIGVCLEGAIIVLACMIFGAFASSGTPGIVDTSASAVTQVWSYLAETIFNMLVLVGLVKGADRIVKEMMAL